MVARRLVELGKPEDKTFALAPHPHARAHVNHQGARVRVIGQGRGDVDVAADREDGQV